MFDKPRFNKLLEFITKLMDRAEADDNEDLNEDLTSAVAALMRLAWIELGPDELSTADTRERFYTLPGRDG